MTFAFTISEVKREFLIKYPYAALDGDLTITVNDTTFFLEGISLLDFALSIRHWLKLATKTNVLFDFDYSPEESTENPVLHLSPLDISHFSLHSAWVENFVSIVLPAPEVTSCFADFLQNLDAYLQREYDVAFANIPLFKQP